MAGWSMIPLDQTGENKPIMGGEMINGEMVNWSDEEAIKADKKRIEELQKNYKEDVQIFENGIPVEHEDFPGDIEEALENDRQAVWEWTERERAKDMPYMSARILPTGLIETSARAEIWDQYQFIISLLKYYGKHFDALDGGIERSKREIMEVAEIAIDGLEKYLELCGNTKEGEEDE